MISGDPVERWEQFELYLKGHMEEKQVRQLEKSIEADPRLADELESVRRAHAMLKKVLAEQQMRETLRQIRTEKRHLPPAWRDMVTWRRATGLLTAACLILLVYLSLTPITLPDAGYDVMALRNIDTNQLPTKQRMAFENFFEGQARMVEGDYVQAAQHFEDVLSIDDLRPYFKEAAEWHLAVSYLKSRQISRANLLYKQLRQCPDCAYEVGWLSRKKMEWQLFIAEWLP